MSTDLSLATYKSPYTISPSYKGFFDEIKNPINIQEQTKELESYIDQSHFTVSYDSGLMWTFEGGTNYWTDNKYDIKLLSQENSDINVGVQQLV